MKTSILVISLLLACWLSSSYANEGFPKVGKTYEIEIGSQRESGFFGRTVTVLSSEGGSWYLVEYVHREVSPSTEKAEIGEKVPAPIVTDEVRRTNLNFDWVVTATEVEE